MSCIQNAEALVRRLGDQLGQKAGIDVVTPLALGWYNHSIPAELGARIPVRGAAGQNALCVLVANSRTIWEPFVEACANDGLLQLDNPLETYIEQHVCSALAAHAPGLRHRIYYSHRRTDDLEGGPEGTSEHVAFQRMAHHAGLAFLDETSHLCLHLRFGPWFSLRCVVIFDDLPFTAPQPAELQNPLPVATRQYVALALHSAVHNTSRKFHVPEVDVEAAEAVIAEASIEPVLEGDSDEEEEGGPRVEEDTQNKAAAAAMGGRLLGLGTGPVRCPSSSARSTVGSDVTVGSGGTTPACSSGCSSPRAGNLVEESDGGEPDLLKAAAAGGRGVSAPEPAGPADYGGEGRVLASAAARLAAAHALPVPGAEAAGPGSGSPSAPAEAPQGGGAFGSPLQVGSLGSNCSRRSSLETEGKPSMRAVAANWKKWLAVRDAPCPGHPWRYSEEQIYYHYTRDRSILHKALLRRNLGPAAPLAPATGLLDPALQSFHEATMAAAAAQKAAAAAAAAGAQPSYCTAATTPAVLTPAASPEPSAVTAA